MQGRLLLVGSFDATWIERLSRVARVDHVRFPSDALSWLEQHQAEVVLVRGELPEIEKLFERCPEALCLEESDSEQSLFLRSILDHLPHMVFVKEAKNLRFVRWNRAGETLIGLSHEEMMGRTDYDFFPPEEAAFFQAKDREVLASRTLLDIPEETLNSKWGPKILHTKKIPICDDRGEPLYLLGISEDITELKELRSLAAARLESARESERRHIARELHDELGQLLTALKLDLDRLEQHLPQPLRHQAEGMSQLLQHTIATVRRLATELRPQILDDLGLRAGLEWLVQQTCQRCALSYEFRWQLGDAPLTDDAKSAFFRISQEALHNVLRHAQASKVILCLEQDGDCLRLTVEDNGIGLTALPGTGDCLGVLGIRERAALLGGTCEIHSPPGRGTRLSVQAPLARCLARAP